jgi:hypothetical protein
MKVKKFKANDERTILTAAIVHDDALRRIAQTIGNERQPFKGRWANKVWGWCFDYHTKFSSAPGVHVEALFKKFAVKERDENTIEIVSEFLTSLSRDYSRTAKEINEDWIVDTAVRYFTKVQLQRKADELQAALEGDDVEEAKRIEQRYSSAPLHAATDWTDLLSPENVNETIRHYEEDRNLISFPGALGKFLNPAFERDAFIAFSAPEKRGKSYWLMEVVYQALRQRRKVLYYVLGDMSLRQLSERFYRRISRRPRRAREVIWPIGIEPTERDEDDEGDNMPRCHVQTEKRFLEGMSAAAVRRASRKMAKMMGAKGINLRTKVFGASVLKASDIELDIQQMSREPVPWVPDTVVLDYADLLLEEDKAARLDYRHQINESWKIMRRISVDYHNCFVTATQAAARSYDQRVIRKKDFSEDKRKNAHVTGMLGINQTADEKKQGVYRLNWPFLRDGEWSEDQYVWVAGCLACACPCIKSSL